MVQKFAMFCIFLEFFGKNCIFLYFVVFCCILLASTVKIGKSNKIGLQQNGIIYTVFTLFLHCFYTVGSPPLEYSSVIGGFVSRDQNTVL